MNYDYIFKCSCGAITITIDNLNYSMTPKTFKELFNIKRLPIIKHIVFNCDHCVNNWGIDLCACGSGLSVDKCNSGLSMCNTPMQDISEHRTHYRGANSWI